MKQNSTLFLFLFFSNCLIAQISVNGINLSTGGGKPASCLSNNYKIISSSVSGGCITFTTSAFQNGAVWVCDAINLNQSFNLNFEANFGSNINSGDGIAFLLQTEGRPQVVGGRAGGIGYALGDGANCQSSPCPIAPSIAVEFDTWNNIPDGLNDAVCNHVSIQTEGIMLASNQLISPTCLLTTGGSVVDGLNHDVCISWDPTSPEMNVFFDGNLIVTYSSNIASHFSDPTSVFWGFTSASGGFAQVQSVCNVVMTTNIVDPSCNAVLPLKILDFSAHCLNDNVLVSWFVESESEGGHYNIQKSSDAINFQTIGRLNTSSDVDNLVEYQFLDNNPLEISYYRIERVNIDNTSDISDTVSSECKSDNNYENSIIFPNPGDNFVNISSKAVNIYNITFFDYTGKVVMEKNNVDNKSIKLDVSGLTFGLFAVLVTNSDGNSSLLNFIRK